MKKALITGINGFAGSHLAEYLINNNLAQVSGTIFSQNERLDNIISIKEKTKLIECDITNFVSVENVLKETQPDIIFHLAAQAFVPESIKNPVDTIRTNLFGTLNIFEAARKNNIDATIHVASSGEVYGLSEEKELPLRETNPLRPQNPYAASKAAIDLFAFQYNKMYGVKTIVTRAFNHAGPKQSDNFVVSNWAKQIAMIEKESIEPVIKTGDLRNTRDFTDVRDVVRAYWLIANKGTPGEVYNVCSGKTVSLKQLITLFLKQTKKKISIIPDPERMREQTTRPIRASFAKLKSVTDWKPEISLQKTISDTVAYWRQRT